jgi:thioredoxin-like negative regulator of GroEL
MSLNRSLVAIAVAVAVVVGLVFYQRDLEYRRVHGRVVEVTVSNFEEEVSQIREQKPVLICFLPENADQKQRQEVDRVAWDLAGKVKVVLIVCDPQTRPVNLLFQVRFVVVRVPAFVVVYKDKVIHGADGSFADNYELKRLVDKLGAP